jgi:hypothetical protein
MKQNPFQFGKIVANPTENSWAQAYNAGNLAVVLSLTQEALDNDSEQAQNTLSLSVLGKDLLNTLEAEYFTLETKTLNTIKQALLTTCEKVDTTTTLSFCMTVIIENVLYVFIYGPGRILMKREDKLGVLLEQKEKNRLETGSGFIQNNDIVILETDIFAKIISSDVLLPCLESNKISEIADILTPIIHERQDGAAAGLVFYYHDESGAPAEPAIQDLVEEEVITHTDNFDFVEKPMEHFQPEENNLKPQRSFGLSHKRRLFLTIAIIIAVVLVGSVFFSLKKQKDNTNQQLYQSLVPPAQQKFDEGKGLIDLNKNLAQEDFQQAKKMLEDAKTKLSKDSPEYKQTTDLLSQVTETLTNASSATASNAQKVDLATNTFLQTISKHSSIPSFAQDDTAVYIADNTSLISISKSTNKEKNIISNKSDWQNVGGLGAYLGNFYVLDTTAGISKYVPSGGSYTKSDYFASGVNPDLSKASGIAIDGSIWIVKSDGSISKYTKGKEDSFNVKGLDKPLKAPSQIFTNVDANNVYILDNGNGRIVVLDKNGNYQTAYTSNILSNAKAIDVSEKDKKIYVLSNNNIYKIDLK